MSICIASNRKLWVSDLVICVLFFVHFSGFNFASVSLSEWVPARGQCLELRYWGFKSPSILGKCQILRPKWSARYPMQILWSDDHPMYSLLKQSVEVNLKLILLLLCQVHDDDELQEIREDDESTKPVVNSKVVKLLRIFITFYLNVKLHKLSKLWSFGLLHNDSFSLKDIAFWRKHIL